MVTDVDTSPIEQGPCKGCFHIKKCSTGFCCAAFVRFYTKEGNKWKTMERIPDKKTFQRHFMPKKFED